MECAVAIEETTRNLLMLVTWLPSLFAAAAIFTLTMRTKLLASGLQRTLLSLLTGFLTLFGTWGLLLAIGGRIFC